MHNGHTAIFQKPNNQHGVTDYQENVTMLDAMSEGPAIFGMGRRLARAACEGPQIGRNESTARYIDIVQTVLNGLEQGYVEYDGKFTKQLYANDVMPALRGLGHDAPFDSREFVPPAFTQKRGAQRAA